MTGLIGNSIYRTGFEKYDVIWWALSKLIIHLINIHNDKDLPSHLSTSTCARNCVNDVKQEVRHRVRTFQKRVWILENFYPPNSYTWPRVQLLLQERKQHIIILHYYIIQCSPHNSGSVNSEILFIQTGDYGPWPIVFAIFIIRTSHNWNKFGRYPGVWIMWTALYITLLYNIFLLYISII